MACDGVAGVLVGQCFRTVGERHALFGGEKGFGKKLDYLALSTSAEVPCETPVFQLYSYCGLL